MDFEEKYLKYKTKYLELKKQLGGVVFPDKDATTYESIAIMAYLNQNKLDLVNERRKHVKLQPTSGLHITLLNFNANRKCPFYSELFESKDFKNAVEESYIKNLQKTNFELVSEKFDSQGKFAGGIWNFFGNKSDLDDKFWVREYKFKDNGELYNFKMDIYRGYIKEKLKVLIDQYNIKNPNNMMTSVVLKKDERKKVEKKDKKGNVIETGYYDYYGYEYKDNTGKIHRQDVYAINSDHYVKTENWKPHISVFKIGEISSTQQYQGLQKIQGDQAKLDYLADEVGRKGGNITQLSFSKNDSIDKLVISARGSNKTQGTLVTYNKPPVEIDV